MKRILLCLICIFSLLGSKAQSYNELVEKAMDYTFKDSLQQAEELFREALRLDPYNARNALLFSNLGTVLNITPYATAILLNRATLYMEKNLTEKAYLDYCNVIDLLPNDKEARLFRAYIYMKRRQYKEARIDYNVILGIDAKHKAARLGLAMLDQKEGRYIAARDGMNLLIEDYPKDASLYKMRANLELEQNLPDAALLDLEEALKLDARDADTHVMMGDIYLQMEKKHEAREAYEKAVSLGVPRMELMEKLKKCK